MNTSAPWSEINFELLSLQRGDHTLMVFVQKEIKKKKINNAYMYVMFASIDPRLSFKHEDDKAIS